MIETDDDDRKRVARDGEAIRVPLVLMDSTQASIAAREVATPRGRYVERLQDAHTRPTRDFEPPAVEVLAPDTPARQRYLRDLERAYLNRPAPWPIGALLQALNPSLASGRVREEGEPDPSEALDAAPKGRDAYIAAIEAAHRKPAA